jgi:hypothetical protein
MTQRFWLSFVAAGCALSAAAAAQSAGKSPPVLELFTSQGCSSCPAADALFKTYAVRRDIVALSLPVDYWDYLGWKDTLGSSKFSRRQRDYAKQRGDGQVYTPQVVVNGRAHVVGSSKPEIEVALKSSAGEGSPVGLTAALADGVIKIDLAAANSSTPDMTVWLVIVQPEVQVDVKAGENRGRKLTYFNVVREIVPAGSWSGAAMTIHHKASTLSSNVNDRIAVLVQKGSGGDIVAAAWIEQSR